MLLVYYIVTLILTKELVMADDDQCTKYHFKSPFYPGESCEDIYNKNPESHERSGYYWITDGPSKVYCGMTYTGSSCEDIYVNNPETGDKSGYYCINDTQWTYCNMTANAIAAGDLIPTCAGVGGGWKRIVNINISAGDDCPSGWSEGSYSGISFCYALRRDYDYDDVCYSVNFTTYGTSYQRVCGRARGYQKGDTLGFDNAMNQTINDHYADGLLITRGDRREHIWSYIAGSLDSRADQFNCPCASGGSAPPPFIGTNYYCESGAANVFNAFAYYLNDPLWDGSGCITSNCCDNPTQPWFYRELSGTSTSDIEARLCSLHEGGFTLIDQLELYIQ